MDAKHYNELIEPSQKIYDQATETLSNYLSARYCGIGNDTIVQKSYNGNNYYTIPHILKNKFGAREEWINKLYNDEKKEADRKAKIYEIYRLSTLIRNKGFDDPQTREFMIRVQEHNGISMGEEDAMNTLISLSEQISSECRDEDANEVAFMVPWALWDKMNMPVQFFEDIIDLPFENGTIKAPAAYDEVLKKEYGDYMVVRRGMGAHEYPVYQDQEETLRDHLGRNPYRYTFPKESFSEERLEPSYGVLYQKLKDLGAEDSFPQIFPTSYLERKQEGRKDVLFLPCKAKWWNTMAPVYERAASDPAVTASIIPIPYFDCDYLGNVGEGHDESSLFTQELGSDKITDFEQYGLERRHPDAIVVQVPYDAFSGTMTVPEILYSNNLLKYTDNLIYVPCFDVGDPISEEDVVNAAMKVLIEQPAVVNSDTVLVGSEVMKKLYVDTLTRLSGHEHREYWEKKIKLQSELAW